MMITLLHKGGGGSKSLDQGGNRAGPLSMSVSLSSVDF